MFVSKEVLSFFDWSKGFHFNVAYTVKADIFFYLFLVLNPVTGYDP